jgi:hypothetical protein
MNQRKLYKGDYFPPTTETRHFDRRRGRQKFPRESKKEQSGHEAKKVGGKGILITKR